MDLVKENKAGGDVRAFSCGRSGTSVKLGDLIILGLSSLFSSRKITLIRDRIRGRTIPSKMVSVICSKKSIYLYKLLFVSGSAVPSLI